MNPLVKAVLLLGGGLWLFWDQISSLLNAPHTGRGPMLIDDPAPTPGAQPISAPPLRIPATSAAPPPPETPTPARAGEPILMLAAANASSAAQSGETRLTIHAWNWYRDRYYASKGAPAPGPALIDPALFPGGNGETPITAAQYHQLVSGQTLAGLGYVYLG